MPKNKTFPITNEPPEHDERTNNRDANEPLSGSKKVKSRNHSRQNHGEGS